MNNKIIVLEEEKRMNSKEMKELVGQKGGVIALKDLYETGTGSVISGVVVAYILFPYDISEIRYFNEKYSDFDIVSYVYTPDKNEIGGLL